LDAIKQAASSKTQVTMSIDGTGAEDADVGVVVIGEKPYAEFSGDSADLALDKAQLQAVANMKKANIPVVVVLLTGRPVILDDVLSQSDALMAAWLPGSEGKGVADVLFGDYAPVGKLSMTWPRSVAQLPLGVNGKAGEPLFKFGYGLTYVR
jgi:beta-glucosidase